MAKLKTQPHDGDVDAFLQSVENEQRRKDAYAVLHLMIVPPTDLTGVKATLQAIAQTPGYDPDVLVALTDLINAIP